MCGMGGGGVGLAVGGGLDVWYGCGEVGLAVGGGLDVWYGCGYAVSRSSSSTRQ